MNDPHQTQPLTPSPNTFPPANISSVHEEPSPRNAETPAFSPQPLTSSAAPAPSAVAPSAVAPIAQGESSTRIESPNVLAPSVAIAAPTTGAPVMAPTVMAPSSFPSVAVSPTQVVRDLANAVRTEVGKAVVGQDEIITQFLVALLVRGHVLLEGVPGIAKTLTAKSLAHALSATFNRVQFTPDLMPADIVGTNVYDTRQNEFSLRRGPIFTDILLADEINRTPPKTQAALLEAMQERRVTIDGETHTLSPFFTVFATQNPIDYEGTYPLPEAQLDRFLLKVTMTYPSADEEAALLVRAHRGFDAHELASVGLQPVVDAARWQQARKAVQSVTVGEGLIRYITTIVGRTRGLPSLTLGASPRASLALLESSKALAALSGRDFVIPEDVKTVALPVLRHRLLVRAETEMEGTRTDDIVRGVLDSVEVPR
ncbi:MAG TPA: AAA family ATPase [Abditibacteriaceae bacterium]|nr:AAA family ATPase [Abditibacteriaceae bacterium]